MNKFDIIFAQATKGIAHDFFKLNLHGAPSVYRERVYCYELYHQLRKRWTAAEYFISGEVDKRGHPRFSNGRKPQPDLLIHLPGEYKNDYAVIEVKHCQIEKGGAEKDLKTLELFLKHDYKRAIYLVYGHKAEMAAYRIARWNIEKIPIEIWIHCEVGRPAILYDRE